MGARNKPRRKPPRDERLAFSATPAARRTFRGILIGVAAVYLLGFGAEPISTMDDQVMLSAAMNLVQTGKLTVPERFAEATPGRALFGRTAATGEVYVKYPPGYPLVLAAFLMPAKAAGHVLGGVAADIILCLPSMLALLAASILVWRTCIRLGFPAPAAHIAATGMALGSYAWPYAGINFGEPLQMLCVAGAFYGLLAAFQEESRWRLYVLGGGLALGYGVLTKSSLGLLMPILALGALWGWTARSSFRDGLVRSSLFALPSLLAGAYLLLVNALLFGSAKDFGYSGETFRASALVGLREVTIGWDKGILWFAPLVVLMPVGAWKLRKHSCRWAAPTLLACCAAYVALIACWWAYRGGSCWGPRLLLPVLPLLFVLAAAALDSVQWRWAGIGLVGLGIAVNLLGVVVNYQSFYIAVRLAPGKPDWKDPAYAQIRGHLWLARVQLAKESLSQAEESVALWNSPPWLARNPEGKPGPYRRFDEPVLNPWPLRIGLHKPWLRRADLWYLRSLMEVAITKYQDGDLHGAQRLMQEGLEIDPAYTPLIAAEGMVYYTSRTFTRALAQFDRSLALDPDYELGWYGRGLTMEALRNPREAAVSYRRLLQTGLRSLSRKEIEGRLARLAE